MIATRRNILRKAKTATPSKCVNGLIRLEGDLAHPERFELTTIWFDLGPSGPGGPFSPPDRLSWQPKSCRLETISTRSLPFIVAQMTTQLHSCMFNLVVRSLIVVVISQGGL